jgi:DNA-binding NtrC family response regulator
VEPRSQRRSRILVVDDDSSSAQALAALLREEGHEAVVSASGAAAISALAGGTWELVLLDPALRDQSGPRVLGYAQELGVPLIVVTSDPSFDPKRSPCAGARGFLYKPIQLRTLLGLIAEVDPGVPA